MHANVLSSTPRAITRAAIVALVGLGASLGSTAAASAQAGFEASISAVNPKPQPCPNGEFSCGTVVTGYGPAAWAFTVTSDMQTSSACGVYQAAVTFVLGDGSTLVLDESGTVCGPGNSLSAPRSLKSYGNPFTIIGSWTVQNASGQFQSLTGAGTDTLKTAGAQISGTYTPTS